MNLAATDTTPVLLTDDEVIACSVISGARWPTPLPTADLLGPQQVEDAGGRGLRSLVIRGLAVQSGGSPALASQLSRLFSAARRERMHLSWFPTLDGVNPVAALPATYCYDLQPDTFAVVSTSADGVHRLTEVGSDELHARVARLVSEAILTAPPDGSPLAPCVVKPAALQADLVTIKPGGAEHRVLTGLSTGELQLSDVVRIATAAEVMDLLLPG